jgi:hypothetical protein
VIQRMLTHWLNPHLPKTCDFIPLKKKSAWGQHVGCGIT